MVWNGVRHQPSEHPNPIWSRKTPRIYVNLGSQNLNRVSTTSFSNPRIRQCRHEVWWTLARERDRARLPSQVANWWWWYLGADDGQSANVRRVNADDDQRRTPLLKNVLHVRPVRPREGGPRVFHVRGGAPRLISLCSYALFIVRSSMCFLNFLSNNAVQ